MVPTDHCSLSLALPIMCLQGPSVTANFDELCKPESTHLKGFLHKQQCPSKTRKPDFPDGDQEDRLCICGRQPLIIPFQRRMAYGLRPVSVGKSNLTDIYTSSLFWNEL